MTELRNKKIQELLFKRDFPAAELLIDEKLREEPASADAYYFLGIFHYFSGQFGLTVDNLNKALSLDPHHTDAAICLSVIFNDVGKYNEAKRVFEQANQSVTNKQTGDNLEIDKKFSIKHLELADLYFRYRRYDEAIADYTKAGILDPYTLDIRIRLAKAYAKKGFISRSMQELQQLKNTHQNYIPARIQLGLLHYSQGNLLDAELEWEGVLDIEPMNREAISYIEMAKQTRTK
ncbi:MAG: tetratricopeptide repeat protein [Candidatus Poribacteria bacterium]